MTVVSSMDFATDQERYFDLAMTEQVFVQRGNVLFTVTRANALENKYLEPDGDLHWAITGEELMTGIFEDMEKFFAGK
ncbi:MAG: hypothetical protein LBE91_09425 [Tannerella sp.]|jgi:hypothetical protein|nr:hypothetical protein [Tannerella sp.]